MAKIREQDIDDLRERADIVDVVSGYSKLKKSGGHTFKGLCPFHTEKTPSFTVDASKNLFYCFGCGEGGNIYHFVQKVENLPFPEAVEWLAHRVGYALTYEEQRPGEHQRRSLRARLIEANEQAARFFHRSLFSSEAETARLYLESRGFTQEVAERWLLGYAPGRDALCRHLLAKGFTREEVEKADLGRTSERDGSLYDTFRQRIIFPTWNVQGDVVGFGARALGDQQPKYLNSAETPVFSKSHVMYGLNRAKSAIARGVAVVVEGYTDVIALHEAGIKEAVATNGVALGESHFAQLKKFTQRAILMLDPDEAGKTATERSFDIHHRLGLEVLVAPLPATRDPADVAQEDGAEAVQKIIDSARPLLEFKIDQTVAKLPTDTPEARARVVREVARVLGLHPDPIARHQYAFFAARRIGVEAESIQRALSERNFERDESLEAGSEQDRRLPGHVKVEREALRLLLSGNKEAAEWLERLDETSFTSPARRAVFAAARSAAADRDADHAELAQDLSGEALSLFTELTVGADELPEPITSEVFERLMVFALERDIKKRRDVLQEINPTVDPKRHDELFTELVGLEAQRRDLLRRLQGAA